MAVVFAKSCFTRTLKWTQGGILAFVFDCVSGHIFIEVWYLLFFICFVLQPSGKKGYPLTPLHVEEDKGYIASSPL